MCTFSRLDGLKTLSMAGFATLLIPGRAFKMKSGDGVKKHFITLSFDDGGRF